ncbi:hypothetical protein HYV80_03590 [Candidatus Woesearchaeota archaeon]|nr:hypothetical protein [Candidatus Woesearchaeota archaeon]
MDKPNIKGAIATFILGLAALKGIQTHLDKITPVPNAPQFKDVNGDGIEDKIIQKRAESELMIGGLRPAFNIDEVFYGVDINGQRVYAAKNVYDGLMRQIQKIY